MHIIEEARRAYNLPPLSVVDPASLGVGTNFLTQSARLPVGAAADGAVVRMGLPVDADTAGSDAPPPDAGDESAQPCGECDGASGQSTNDDFIDDAEVVNVKVLPVTPSPMAFLCFFAVLAALLALCAVVYALGAPVHALAVPGAMVARILRGSHCDIVTSV